MLYTKIDEKFAIAILEADGPLTKSDFKESTSTFRAYVGEKGKLKGVAVYTEKFPGWGSLSDIPFHFKFAFEHRQKAEKVALVTNSPLAVLVKMFGPFLFGTKAKVFKYDQLAVAKDWLVEEG